MHKTTKKGVVVSQTCPRTAKVRVGRTIRHPRYNKVLNRHNDFLVETNGTALKVGSEVEIVSVPRISKRKSFVIVGEPNVV